MTGGGRPAGGRHCNTSETPFCTTTASFLSFDHKGDPANQRNDKERRCIVPLIHHVCKTDQILLPSGLTGLPDDNFVGDGGAVVVLSRALVSPLVSLGLFSADVNDQSSRTGLHQDFGVFLNVKVGPVSRPRKTRMKEQPENQLSSSLSVTTAIIQIRSERTESFH